jgi:putative membrane protein
VQVVVAVVRRSDSYVELPWKAFALGASVAALGVVIWSLWRPDWVTSQTTLLQAVVILGTGAACALLAVFVPSFARLFLRAVRREVEVRQYAQSLFLTRELFRTHGRAAVLILVSQFERRIEILPDVGLHGRVAEAEWRAIIDTMAPHLREARPSHALREALAAVEQVLVSKGLRGTGAANELPDRPVEEQGA